MRRPDTDEIATELYLVPPTRFVATRDQLVRKARAAGNRELAGELKSLRRPTQSAWLVNLLTRHERAPMERLFALGRELRQAQTGLDETQLRRLSAQRQTMVADLVDRARRRAADAGLRPTDGVLAEVGGTLRAALVDLAASSTVLSGRLVRPMSHSGFGPMPRAKTPATSRPPSPPAQVPPAPDVELAWSFWPVEDELGRRREHAAPKRGARQHMTPARSRSPEDERPRQHEPATQERRATVEAEETVRRAEAELAAAESTHWQREQELAYAEAAAEAARDRLEWLDQQRMEARRETVTEERQVAEAQSTQRAAVRAVAEARRLLEAAETVLRSAGGQPPSEESDG